MENTIFSILDKMKEIKYGWVDQYGVVHKNAGRNFFIKNYRMQTIEETLKYKVGTCWEQVELIRYYLEKENIPVQTFIIIYNDESKIARHTIAIANCNNKYYWMESSWNNTNIVSYNNIKEILQTLIDMFPRMYKINDFNINKIEIYQYEKPKEHLTYNEFTEFCKEQKKIILKR